MGKRTTLLLAVVYLVFYTLSGGVSTVVAQSAETGQALEIAPPVINLTADPGQTITTQISLRDISSGKLIVQGQVNDFIAAGEDGTPKILLEEQDSNPYSLKKWIDPLPQLTLLPKQIKNLPVTIRVPKDAAPGGYYGVVRFTAAPPELEGTGVSLSASLGALVLIRVSGNAKESLTVEDFYVTKNGQKSSISESTPIQFVQRLKNNGNVHVQPSGQLSITDMFGKKIAVLNVNQPPRNALPGSIRRFEQSLDSSVIGNKQLFGRYTAQMRLTYGDSKQVITKEITFWVIPYRLIGGAVVLLIASFFILRYSIKRYNRTIIRKAQNSRRK